MFVNVTFDLEIGLGDRLELLGVNVACPGFFLCLELDAAPSTVSCVNWFCGRSFFGFRLSCFDFCVGRVGRVVGRGFGGCFFWWNRSCLRGLTLGLGNWSGGVFQFWHKLLFHLPVLLHEVLSFFILFNLFLSWLIVGFSAE